MIRVACLLLAALHAATVPALAADSGQPRSRENLSVTRIGSPPATADRGATFDVSGRVRNSGTRDAPATVKLTLRRGTDSGPQGIGLGRTRVEEVGAGDSERFGHEARVPAELAAGDYGLSACVRKRRGASWRCAAARDRMSIAAPGGSGETPPPGETGPPGNPPTVHFTPGARSAGDALFPEIGNGGYDALHYEIALDYSPVTNNFNEATTTITARATQNLSGFSLDFQGLDIDGVSVDGTPAAFTRDATKLIVTPAAGIPNGTEFVTEVDYNGVPDEVTDPDGAKEGWIHNSGPTLDGAYTVNQPIGAQSWYPNNNHPSDKATFDHVITVPMISTALGTGELVSTTDNGDGTQTWHWREDDPTATYLATSTVGSFNFAEGTITETTPNPDRTLTEYRAIDSSYTLVQIATINTALDDIEPMTNFLGELYGPYPFDSTGAVVDVAPALGYALENQTKPHFPTPTSASGDILLHELAHQWMGDSITAATWSDIWFNEGWAQWSEWCWADGASDCPTTPAAQFDVEYADAGNDWTIAPAVLDGDPAELFNNFATYIRGAMTIQGYREIVGQTEFLTLASRLNTEFRHSNISTRRFIDLAKEVSAFTGADLQRLEDYFQQWLYGETKPTITPDTF